MTLIDVEAFSVEHTHTITILNSSFEILCNILNGNQNDSIAHERELKAWEEMSSYFELKKEEE